MILIPKIQTIVPCEKQDGKIKKKKKQEKKVEYTFQASKNDVELQMRRFDSIRKRSTDHEKGLRNLVREIGKNFFLLKLVAKGFLILDTL